MKPRSDSVWNNLSQEQRELVEGWLFDENLSYKDALERAQKELGITASLSSLAAFYRRLAHERKSRTFEQAVDWLSKSDDCHDRLRVMEHALAHSVTIAAYDLALKPAAELDVDKLTALNKVLSERRDLELRDARLKLDIERAGKAYQLALAKDLRETILFKKQQDHQAALDNMDFATLDKCNEWLNKLGREEKGKPESQKNSGQEPAK
jgi:hypothetical protein